MNAYHTGEPAATHMQRQELAAQLVEKHKAFISYINSLTQTDFEQAANKKWTAGQQLEHILLAVRPLNQVFYLPNFGIRMLFGKANRPGRSYEALVQKYKDKLQQGGRASGRFVPKAVAIHHRLALTNRLEKAVQKLSRQVQAFSEQELDRMILPHPLLGKLTLREMIYFTIYHVQHHHEATRRNLNNF